MRHIELRMIKRCVIIIEFQDARLHFFFIYKFKLFNKIQFNCSNQSVIKLFRSDSSVCNRL